MFYRFTVRVEQSVYKVIDEYTASLYYYQRSEWSYEDIKTFISWLNERQTLENDHGKG